MLTTYDVTVRGLGWMARYQHVDTFGGPLASNFSYTMCGYCLGKPCAINIDYDLSKHYEQRYSARLDFLVQTRVEPDEFRALLPACFVEVSPDAV